MKNKFKLLFVDTSDELLQLLVGKLDSLSYESDCQRFEKISDIKKHIDNVPCDIIVYNNNLTECSLSDLLIHLKSNLLDISLIVVSESYDPTEAVQTIKAGVRDYAVKDNVDGIVLALVKEMEGLAKKRIAKKVQAEFKKSMDFFLNIIESSIDGIVVYNSDGKMIQVNRAVMDMIDYKREELIGKYMKSFTPAYSGNYETSAGEQIHIEVDGDAKETDQNTAVYGGDSPQKNLNRYMVRRDNKIIPIEENIGIIKDEHGREKGSVSIIRDITERKRSELKLEQANRELADINTQLETAIAHANQLAINAEIANMAKSEFLANMSHEIRTPLNGILGFVDMLLDSDLTAEQSDYLNTVKESGDLLLTIINEVLDFSKIESGQIELEEIDFDPELLCYNVCDIVRPKIGSKKINLFYKVSEDVPAIVKGDPHRFKQIIVNLIGNAVKFTDEGEIELLLDVAETHENKVKIHASVRDTGIGISKKKIGTIFDAFKQADGSTTRKYGGTGLGLTICKKIANLMEGDVWAESKKGRGSTFHVTGWLLKTEKRQVQQSIKTSPYNRKILLVEPDQINRELLHQSLTAINMRVVVTTQGSKASRILQESAEQGDPFDICAVNMQVVDGDAYELPAIISAYKIPPVKFIAFSPHIHNVAGRCRDAGFHGFLPYPVNKQKLHKMIKHLLTIEADPSNEKQSGITTQYSVTEDIKHSTNILLTEDNPVNQKLACKMLQKAGYPVVVASNGKEAVTKYTNDPDKFDLIFMDIQMPEMDGLTACKKIRSAGFIQVPIIAMTANVLQRDYDACMDAGMNDFVPKPIKREKVFEMIQKWILERNSQNNTA